MKLKENEKGEVMLEGMIIITITIFVLIWILAIGFVYYQKYLVTAITNDATVKIAATYNKPDSDLMMGYMTSEQLTERDLYRGFNNNSLANVNKSKAEAYVKYCLNRTNFSGTISDVKVDMKLVHDSTHRKHVEITTICEFNTPFGSALKYFGMNSKTKYRATGRADCTDIIDYISTIDFEVKNLSDDNGGKIIKTLNSLIRIFNHIYAKS